MARDRRHGQPRDRAHDHGHDGAAFGAADPSTVPLDVLERHPGRPRAPGHHLRLHPGLRRPRAGVPGGTPRSSYATAGLGAAIGALSQVAWLSDPAPRLNWLLIAPHRFSFAGWYHAVYLTLTSAYVGGVSWEALRRAARAPRELLASVFGGRGATAVLAACGIFVLTVVADSLPSAATSSSLTTIVIIVSCPAALLAIAAWRLGHAVTVLRRPLAHALLVTALGALVIATSR